MIYFMTENKQLSPELNLIKEYLIYFVKAREVFHEIYKKAKKEKFSEDYVDILLYDRFQEAIKKSSTTNLLLQIMIK